MLLRKDNAALSFVYELATSNQFVRIFTSEAL